MSLRKLNQHKKHKKKFGELAHMNISTTEDAKAADHDEIMWTLIQKFNAENTSR